MKIVMYCFLDHDPYNEGHVLILPKKHFKEAEELDEYTADSIMKASILISKAVQRLFNPDGITICQNGGIFDELTHYHMHGTLYLDTKISHLPLFIQKKDQTS